MTPDAQRARRVLQELRSCDECAWCRPLPGRNIGWTSCRAMMRTRRQAGWHQRSCAMFTPRDRDDS